MSVLGSTRPLIRMVNNKIYHNEKEARVVIRQEVISVGCTDVTPAVLFSLLEEHKRLFPQNKEFVIQEGYRE